MSKQNISPIRKTWRTMRRATCALTASLLFAVLLTACDTVPLAPPTRAPSANTPAATHPALPTFTPYVTPDLALTADAERFQATVQAYQTETAERKATERAATAEAAGQPDAEETATPAPAPSTPTSNPASPNIFAHNDQGSQTRGDVRVRIVRILFAEKTAVQQTFPAGSAFDNTDLLGEIVYEATNTGSEIAHLSIPQGSVILAGQLIELQPFALDGERGDDFSEPLAPGQTLVGGLWFGIQGLTLDDIQSLTLLADAPLDSSNQTKGEAYLFEFDLSAHTYAPPSEALPAGLE